MFSTNKNRKNVVGKSRSPLLFVLCLSLSHFSLSRPVFIQESILSRAWLILHTPLSYWLASVGPIAARRSASWHPRNRFTRLGKQLRPTRAASLWTPRWPAGSRGYRAEIRSVPNAGTLLCSVPPFQDLLPPYARSRLSRWRRWESSPLRRIVPGGLPCPRPVRCRPPPPRAKEGLERRPVPPRPQSRSSPRLEGPQPRNSRTPHLASPDGGGSPARRAGGGRDRSPSHSRSPPSEPTRSPPATNQRVAELERMLAAQDERIRQFFCPAAGRAARGRVVGLRRAGRGLALAGQAPH
jgi:hypothetical protein